MRDLAQHLNVSQATVSRALRNDPRISKTVREHINATAAKLGFRPDPMLAAFFHHRHKQNRRQITDSLAWIQYSPDPEQQRSLHELDAHRTGAREAAGHSGFRLEEFVLRPGLSSNRLQKILLARNIRGVLIPPCCEESASYWENFSWDRFCIVRLGYAVETPRAHLVAANETNSGATAFENAWRLGYRRIGMVSLNPTRYNAGYFMGQAGHNVPSPFPPLLLGEGDQALAKLKSWMGACNPDAILTDVSDLRNLLEQIGVQVPHDVGLASFSRPYGNVDAGIDPQFYEVGRTAAKTLISLIKHNEYGIPTSFHTTLLEGTWVDGKTLPPAIKSRRPILGINFADNRRIPAFMTTNPSLRQVA